MREHRASGLRLAHLALATAFLAACSGGGGGGANHPTDDGEAVAGEMLIGVKAEAFGTSAVEAVIATAGDIVTQDAKGSFYRIRRLDGLTEEQAAARLSSADIVYVERNYLAHGFAGPADGAAYAASYSAKVRAELEAGWVAYGALDPATPVILAVLDTGVLTTHDDLKNKLADPANARNFVVSPSSGVVTDDNGHGTALAGIAAAESNDAGIVGVSSWDGLADPKLVTILPVKVADLNNVSNHAAIAAGINWAVSKGARVVLLSLGSASASYTLQKAVEDAYKAGVLVVAAAGNDGVAAPRYPAAYQAANQRVLSVSSANQTDFLDVANKANFGPKVNLLAPGTGLTVPGIAGDSAYVTGQYGSSLAAAHVAGAAALLLSAYPPAAVPGTHAVGSLTVDEVRSAILAGLDSYGRTSATGIIAPAGGRFNLEKAVTAAGRIQAATTGPAGANLPGSVVFSFASVRGGAVLTGTVVMTGEVPTVQRVDLTSTDPELGFPDHVSVPAGARSVNFPVTTTAVSETKTVSVTATANSASVAGTFDLTSPGVAGVALSPASVVGGLPSTGTVTLAGPAPESFTVTLSDDNGTSSTGSSLSTTTLSIPKGATSATFTVTTVAVASAKTVRITATAPNGAAHADLAILPLLGSVSFGAASIKNGSATTFIATLNAVQATDTVVTLAWTDAGGALTSGSKPTTVTVAKGKTSATLTVTSVVGAADRTVTVHGTAGLTTTADASLTVLAARMLSLAFPTGALINWGDGQVSHDGHVTGTVTLDAPAPEGTLVYLSASDSIVAIPVSAAVPAGGGNKATFTLTPAIAVASTAVVVSASLTPDHLNPKTATVTLKPALLSLTLTPTQAAAGTTITGTVTMNAAAPAAISVALATDDTSIVPALPATATVASGAKSGSFTFSVGAVPGTKAVTITATYMGVSASDSFTGKPPAIASVTFAPTSGYKDFLVTGTVTLTAAAFAETPVALASSDSALVSVPASVTVHKDELAATFAFAVGTVAAQKAVTVTATLAGATKTGTFTAKVMQVASVVFTPTSGLPGDLVSGRVTLNAPALVDSVVTLTASDSTIVPGLTTVTVAKDATYQDFTFTVGAVTAQKVVTVTAAFNGSSKAGSFTGKPITVTGLTFNPTSAYPGSVVTGTVTLSKTVGAATAVTLSASDRTIVPGLTTVTVPADASSASFTFTVGAVAAQKVVTVTATLNGASKNGTFTGKPTPPPTLLRVELDKASGLPGTVVTVTATLSGNAPTATNVTLLAANTTIVPGLTRVTVPQGASSGTATFTTGPVASQTAVLITASLAGSANQTVTFTGLVPPPTLVSLVLSPKSGHEGARVTGTVTLSANSIGATTVDLATNDGVIAPGLTTMTVENGSNTGTFSFVVGAVSARKQVTVTASLAGSPNRVDTFTGLTYVVFATSDATNRAPDFGSLEGADAFCQARADAGIASGTLPSGTYVAFLSTASVDGRDRIADVAYGLPDGSPIATNKADLFDGIPGIDHDEFGQLKGLRWVWTGSTVSGTAHWDRCAEWTATTSGSLGSIGYADAPNGDAWGYVSLGCQNVAALACFQQPPKVVFVTSTHHDANFGGLTNADAFCQARADVGIAAGALPAGTYVAYLSTSTVDAKDRIVDDQYVLPDHTLVAANKAALLSGTLEHAISLDETGNPHDRFVWTGTNADGTAVSGDTCSDWTSVGSLGEYGWSILQSGWSSSNHMPCTGSNSLYCFQQPPKTKVVFVTSAASQHDGNFGGLAGADAFCEARAAAGAGHGIPQGKAWRALLSADNNDARDRIVDGRYVLPDGALVATSKTALLNSTLLHAIDQDELGNSGLDLVAFTGSTRYGASSPEGNCVNWTSNSGPIVAGQSGSVDHVWNGYRWMGWLSGAAWWCGQSHSLYCFEQ